MMSSGDVSCHANKTVVDKWLPAPSRNDPLGYNLNPVLQWCSRQPVPSRDVRPRNSVALTQIESEQKIKFSNHISASACAFLCATTAIVQAEDSKPSFASPADFGVTDYAYKVSETDFNIKRSLAKAAINEWAHQNDVSRVKTQQVIRENQDVIYSSAVVDCSKGATFTVPKSGTYHVIEIIDLQNYIVDVVYPGKSVTVTPDNLTYGNYVYLNMRIRILPEDQGGLSETLKLQKQATIQAASANPYETPDIVVTQEKMEEIRKALIDDVQAGKMPETSNAQGTPYRTHPQDHLYATAYGWGGLSVEHAAYLPLINQTVVVDGKAKPSSVTLSPPKIDYGRGGFWSITTYNAEGWLAEDKAAISHSEATPNDDGTYTIRFNSPGEKNNINTPAQFTALLRIYVPANREGVIDYLTKASKELIIK